MVFECGVEDAGGGGSVEGDGCVVSCVAGVGENECRVGLGIGAYGRPVPGVFGRGVDGGVLDEGVASVLVFAGGEGCPDGLELRVRHRRLTLGLLGVGSVLFEVLLRLAVVAEECCGDDPVRTIRTPPTTVTGSDMVTDPLDPERSPARARADRAKVQTDMTTPGTTPARAGRTVGPGGRTTHGWNDPRAGGADTS
ncbi:hypothetical protein SSCG_03248 [Streptomyces clavuligerus]|nr:hypothetical protein SSCG_03248 [Streptomyces clavuligerus]